MIAVATFRNMYDEQEAAAFAEGNRYSSDMIEWDCDK